MSKRTANVDALTITTSLAKTGRYRNVAEVEVVLRSKARNACLDNKIARQWVDALCYRARRARKWTL